MSDTAIDRARRLLEGFALQLRMVRQAEGCSLRALAEATGIRADTLNRIEAGLWIPSPEHHQILTEWLLQHRCDVARCQTIRLPRKRQQRRPHPNGDEPTDESVRDDQSE